MDFFQTSTTTSVDSYIDSEIYGELSNQGEGIDLRLEMNYILYGNADRKAKGHWVVLRKYDRSKPSIFYSKHTKEGVGGPAFEYADTLLRTRRVLKSDVLDPLKVGLSVQNKFIYYFEYNVHPKRGDHIIELSIEDHKNPPTITQDIMLERYVISSTTPYRLENGNIQYYSVFADYDEVTN